MAQKICTIYNYSNTVYTKSLKNAVLTREEPLNKQ